MDGRRGETAIEGQQRAVEHARQREVQRVVEAEIVAQLPGLKHASARPVYDALTAIGALPTVPAPVSALPGVL